MECKIVNHLREIAQDLDGSKVALPLAMKLRAAELVLHLMVRRKNFGLFVILGWMRKWHRYLDRPDSEQDIFARHRLNIMDTKPGERRRYDVSATVNFDGAILIDRRGSVVHSGVLIEGLRPRLVAEQVNPGRFSDLSEQFGFETKVHARHLTAIASSYVFKGTTVFTVSEETGAFHVFESGVIMHHH
jgi:hypothetical protein